MFPLVPDHKHQRQDKRVVFKLKQIELRKKKKKKKEKIGILCLHLQQQKLRELNNLLKVILRK